MNKQLSILGCGWLGTAVAKHYIANGWHVNGSTTREEKVASLNEMRIAPYVFHLGTEISDQKIKEFLEGSEVLLIAIPPGRKSDPLVTYPAKIKQLLPSIPDHLKVIFISSTSVYQNTNGIVTEELDPQPETASGKAVLFAEQLLREALGERLTIIRFSGLMGPDRFPGRFLAGKKEVPNGKAPVNMIQQTDCIQLIAEVINQACWGEIFNGCADDHPTREDFYTKAALKLGLEPPTFKKEAAIRFKIISNEKSKEMLSMNYCGLLLRGAKN